MSEIKNELIDELLNEGTSATPETANTEMPVLENLLIAQDSGTGDKLNLSIPDTRNTTDKLDEAAQQDVDVLIENTTASTSIITQVQTKADDATQNAAEINAGISEAGIIDHVLEIPDSNIQKPNEDDTLNKNDTLKQIELPEVIDSPDVNIQELNGNVTEKQAEVSKNLEIEDAMKDDNIITENLSLISKDLLNLETEETSKQNVSPETDDKHEENKEILKENEISNIKETDDKHEENKEILKENEISNIKESETLDEDVIPSPKVSENINEPTKELSEPLSEIGKNINKDSEDLSGLEKEKNVADKDDAVIKTDQNSQNLSTEQIEPMDTCDSQESLNLIIDETSNTTENKDDSSEICKNDDDTNMEIDNDNVTSTINKEMDVKNPQKEDEIKNTSIEKKGSEAIEVQSKAKDDDVIAIEQPPVPIIEIDDEDEIETTYTQPTTKVIEEKQEQTPMVIDEIDKEIPSKENENKSNEKIQKEEDTLLDVSSEKPLGEVLKVVEPDICEEEDVNVEIFYNKECINYECPRKHKQYLKVPQFAFSYFKVTKKKFKVQYICADCYDKALEMYEEFCGLISAKQPLLLESIPSGRQEFVEIIDSSDDETTNDNDKAIEPTKSSFAKNDLSLIEAELHNTIKSVLNKVEIQNQLTWSKTILSERLKRLQVETEYVDSELKSLQKKADKMHEGLYSCPKIKIRQLQPLDLNSGKFMSFDHTLQKEVQPIPPVGEIERPAIQVNSIYFAVKNNPIASWVPCRVIEQVDSSVSSQKNVKHYKIKFIKNQIQIPKTVPAKYLAYYDPPTVRLPIGTRVIAYFNATSLARGREKINVQSAFYPGIIAEPLKPNNKFRYLIFYDDGYTQYVYHKDVRLVCHVSECVWEDVHPASRDFIQKYLTQYSINRPMVQTQKGQSMNTESNGYWLHARVVDIDCSLVLMQFEGSKSHTEWIYRGSLRLGPVFKEYQKSLQKNSTVPVSRLPRRTEPFIRYTEDEENTSQQQAEKSNENSRAVARKTFGRPESMMNSGSTSQQQPQPTVKHLNNSTIYVEDENKPKGKVVYYTAKRNLPPRKYKPHICSPACLFEITHNLSAYSPLSKPLLSGWERFIIRQKIKRVVTYRAPCGKIMRNMKELHHYLRATNNSLNVDNFDFSHETNCLAEYVIESAIVQKRDISGGQEKMAIPLVNYYDNTLPPECKYSAKVIPTEGVHINTDPAFLVGCDCEDDCIDKNKCACWQLTLAGAKYGNPNAAPEEVGYQYRRLLDHVPTGIYECNVNCKCKSSCLNRVVQNSLTMKLQVFKTSNRGWGLRCINDIPRGSFVCVYAGHLLTEAKANEGGQDAGDEYFAELDYIEVAEQIKEGYESEVELPEPEEEDTYNPEGDDDEFTPSKSWMTRARQRQNASKTTRSSNQEEDSQERQVINFNPNADMNEDSGKENSIRKLYGRDEACYVMDAKISGNLGRYFNHSCSPNMFVQNVFVETHDLRFPNVAFFSSCNIRAGTELTWNYNYEVGVVPGKVLYCQCGAPNCRLRLL